MNRYLNILLAGTCVLIAIAGCQKTEPRIAELVEREITITAGLEGGGILPADGEVTVPETKTLRRPDLSVWWTAHDAISVFYGSGTGGGSKFTSTNNFPAAQAQFKGRIGVFTGGGESGVDVTSFWGVYPYSTQNTCDGSSVTLTIPSEQVSAEGTFAVNQWPTVAKSTALAMSFKNVACGYKFKVETEGITSLKITAASGSLSGKIKVTMGSDGIPVMTTAGSNSSEVIVRPEGSSFKTDEYYYVTMIHNPSYTSGITWTFYTNTKHATYICDLGTEKHEYPSGRSKFKVMDYKDRGLTWEAGGDAPTSPFNTYLGKTSGDIVSKLNTLWDHYFASSDNNKRLYYDNSEGSAYIFNPNDNDVRSMGQSWGMMICVQTDHQNQFDKLWKFAKQYMLHTSGTYEGLFRFNVQANGTSIEYIPEPGADVYFAAALLFASHRWGDTGTYNYNNEAQYILSHMFSGGDFNADNYIVYAPGVNTLTLPANDVPALLEVFAQYSNTNKTRWEEAASVARSHLYKSSHSSSGLFVDYNDFDGLPSSSGYVPYDARGKYYQEARRCAMNIGMDYLLYGKDKTNQETMAKRLIDFFESDGYTHSIFNWDGTGSSGSYTEGQAGANAVACYALMSDSAYTTQITTNMQNAWDVAPMTGMYRYYDGLVHYMSMLLLCDSFKIW